MFNSISNTTIINNGNWLATHFAPVEHAHHKNAIHPIETWQDKLLYNIAVQWDKNVEQKKKAYVAHSRNTVDYLKHELSYLVTAVSHMSQQ